MEELFYNHIVHGRRGTTAPDGEQPRGFRNPRIFRAAYESGVFDITISGRTERLRAGDGFLVPANELHSAVAVEAGILLDTFAPMREDFLA